MPNGVIVKLLKYRSNKKYGLEMAGFLVSGFLEKSS